MPIYEYKCNKCGLVFEARQKFSDAPLTTCKRCDGEVSKLISNTAFSLKGGGWYEQGYSQVQPSCSKAESGACSKAAG
jgi:putative FmdB family regulatory protein